MIDATIIGVEHLIDDTLEWLLYTLESTGRADKDVKFIREHQDVTLTRLYLAGLKAGWCIHYVIDGDRYPFGGSERESVKQMVFRYCNEKEAQAGREARTRYRDKYKAIGGSESYFAKWIVPHPSRRPSPSLRAFFKLVVWLDISVVWGPIPSGEWGEGRRVLGTSEKWPYSKVARSRSISRPIS